ncbi:hypothetical protein M1403_01800 [Patescibacteria group bacterium]|nr:hypothetical protein [Patescibacteria group bacterium]
MSQSANSETEQISGMEDVYFKLLRRYDNLPPISNEEEAKLVKEAVRGSSTAKEELIGRHLKTTIRIARRFLPTYSNTFPDIVQAGLEDLIGKSAEKFDSSVNDSFDAFYASRVQGVMKNLINQEDNPLNSHRCQEDLNQVERLEIKLGHTPRAHEIHHHLRSVGEETARSLASIYPSKHSLSLDEPVPGHEEEIDTLEDYVADSRDQFQDILTKETFSKLAEIMTLCLTPKEQMTLRAEYGFNGTQETSGAEIARHAV